MERTLISEIFADPKSFDKVQVTVGGWIRTLRAQKTFGFIELNDGSYFKSLQVVFEDGILDNYKDIAKQNVGAALVVAGTLVYTPQAKQPIELKAAKIEVEGASTPEYPLQKKRHTLEYLRTIAHLRPRTNTFSAVFRVTTLDLQNVPKNPDGTVDYTKDFFGKSANLTVSGQLNAESFAQAFGNVYTFGPTFRAENSNTQRHAAEFWMIEPEMAFADLNDYMDTAEAMIKFVIGEVLRKCPAEMEFFSKFMDKGLMDRLHNVVENEFARIPYTQAVALLEQAEVKFDYPVSWGYDLQTEHERYLTEHYFKKPVFVTDYPKEIKAFYMRLNDDGKTVAAADCLVPGIGEIIGGSQREERLEVLEARMQELGLNPEDYWWYLDLRRYGSTHHAGYGLGFERLIMYLTGVSNIRDVIPHPRTVGNADF